MGNNRQGSIEIGVVAGELSGDLLGADLIQALNKLCPHEAVENLFSLSGMAGPAMQKAGCQAVCTIDQLSVMGLYEVFRALPRIYFRVYRRLFRHFLKNRPVLFVGIDSPDFNLRLAGKLKKYGIKTVQYVSPTVWAWRASRVETIRKNIDHILVLFPFESEFYRKHGVPCTYVGHPMADQIPLSPPSPEASRRNLGISAEKEYLAVLPGSRVAEVQALLADFLETARLCQQQRPDLDILIPAATPGIASHIRQMLAHWQGRPDSVHVFDGQASKVIGASNAVLAASGTATLEIMLMKRPMVVAYRLGRLTYMLAKRMYYSRFFALPNLLADSMLVPEYLQDDIDPESMAGDLLNFLGGGKQVEVLLKKFSELHHTLRCDAGITAGRQILKMLEYAA